MKKALIIVFSGTGNTLTVAGMIRDGLARRGMEADILSIGREMKHIPVTTEQYGLLIFGYPIYAFNAPHIFREFLKAFRPVIKPESMTAVIFKVSGEPLPLNNGSSHSVKKLLRNYTIIGDYHFLMPYNIIFRFPDSLARQMYHYAEQYSDIMADNIIQGKTSFIPYTIFHRMLSFVFRIQHLGAILNSRLYRVHRKTCTRCLRCVKGCPVGNIDEKNGRIIFGSKCQMCMRCSFYCPEDAVRIGFLDFWRVNGPYDFSPPFSEEQEKGITPETKGLYRIYLPYFNNLDRLIKTKKQLTKEEYSGYLHIRKR